MKTKISFQQFHNEYGKAYGRKLDRLGAERAWKRLSDHDRRAAIAGIAAYREFCLKQGIAMKFPSGYLSLHRWEIEVVDDDGVTKNEHSDTPALVGMDEW